MKRILTLAALAALAACDPSLDGVWCAQDSDCSKGAACIDNVCVGDPEICDVQHPCRPGRLCSAGVCIDDTRPQACDPDCGALQACVEKQCVDGFDRLEILEPLQDAASGSPVYVKVALQRRAGALNESPTELVLAVSSAAGDLAPGSLARTGGTNDRVEYAGTWTAPASGTYTFKAKLVDIGLESAPVSVSVNVCTGTGGAFQFCGVNGWQNAFTGVEIVAPAASTRVGAAVPVRVRVVRVPAAVGKLDPPATASLTATALAGAVPQTVTLSDRVGDEYTAQWLPQANGDHKLIAAAAAHVTLTSPEITVTVDRRGPLLTFKAPPMPTRSAIETDSVSPTAYRRDELLPVEVWTPDSDYAEGTFKLKVQGTTTASVLEVSQVTVVSAATECDSTAKFCWRATVPLWSAGLVLGGIRGNFSVVATAQDDLGNASPTTSRIQPVTRHRWTMRPGGGSAPIWTAPAIGPGGDVVVTTDAGIVYGIGSNGVQKWRFVTQGEIAASPAVGLFGSTPRVVVAANYGTHGTLFGIDPASQGDVTAPAHKCSMTGANFIDLGIVGSLGAVALASGATGAMLAGLPDQNASDACAGATLPGISVGERNGLAIQGARVFFGDDADLTAALHGFEMVAVTASTAEVSGFPLALPAGMTASKPMVASGQLVAAIGSSSSGQLVRTSTAAPSLTSLLNAPLTNGVYDPILLSGNQLVVGTTGASAFAYAMLGGGSASFPLDSVAPGAPVSGAAGNLYLATRGGTLFAYDAMGEAVWSGEVPATSAPLALDCNRAGDASARGTTGTLYVGSEDGRLAAFVVDDPGLSQGAPWPKFHRDPGNTADAGASLACPQ